MSKIFPTLYHKGKSGETYSWRVWSEDEKIHTLYGLIDGKKQQATKSATPKNVGRSNATTPEEQADIEALAMFQFKLERKYSETKEEAQEELFLPMLAQDFEKQKKRVTYPVYVQPKFDGVRCMAYWDGDSVVLLSRSGKPYNVPHISKALEFILPTDTLFDGEIYQHGISFQELTRRVKKQRKETEELSFYVYDVVFLDRPEDHQESREIYRDTILTDIGVGDCWSHIIKSVKTEVADNEERVYELQRMFVSDGYEGAIVRVPTGIYSFGYRSKDLLKVKTFEDAEFKVVGYTHGVGKFENCVIWICETPEGRTFNVTPLGTMAERARYLAHGGKYVGEWLKVKFFGLSEDGIPRFPVGVGFRLKEDM